MQPCILEASLLGSIRASRLVQISAEGAQCNSLGQRPRSECKRKMSAEGAEYLAPSGRLFLLNLDPGASRFALAPGYFISRLWRDERRELAHGLGRNCAEKA